MKFKQTAILGAGLLSVASFMSAPVLADDATNLRLMRGLELNGTQKIEADTVLKDPVAQQGTAQVEGLAGTVYRFSEVEKTSGSSGEPRHKVLN